MLNSLASHPVTSIFLFGLLGRLSSAWCRLLQQEFFVLWKYCLIQTCCWLVQKTVARSVFFTHKLFALCHWFLFFVLRKPLFFLISAKGVDIIFVQHHVLIDPVSFKQCLQCCLLFTWSFFVGAINLQLHNEMLSFQEKIKKWLPKDENLLISNLLFLLRKWQVLF